MKHLDSLHDNVYVMTALSKISQEICRKIVFCLCFILTMSNLCSKTNKGNMSEEPERCNKSVSVIGREHWRLFKTTQLSGRKCSDSHSHTLALAQGRGALKVHTTPVNKEWKSTKSLTVTSSLFFSLTFHPFHSLFIDFCLNAAVGLDRLWEPLWCCWVKHAVKL